MASSQPRRKIPVVPLAGFVIVLVAAAALLVRGVNLTVLGRQAVGIVQSLGPWTFFSACAVLPAIGAPLSLFTITAGDFFAQRLTLAGVIGATLVAIAVNLALSYWLARYALRPLLSRIIERYGYKIPKVTADNALSIALAVRLTPGPPLFVQSYILGLAQVPFRLYMVVSWICVLPWAIGAIVLGKGILNGNFRLAVYGLGVIVVAVVVVQALRKRYVSKPG
ncbi:MAG TPA: VTT domain-containing protein [Opitutaceae bacterium]|jgi:uncharacterized membrane protein YdjX (TVP38/TMEM64 family)